MSAALLSKLKTSAGHPCPPADGHSPNHAITTHLPTWQAILDFVEGKPELMASLKNIYPRMMPIVQVADLTKAVLSRVGTQDQACFLYPTRFAAESNQSFAISVARKDLQVDEGILTLRAFELGTHRIYGLFFPQEKQPSALPYWQNAGVGISSRFSEACLRHIDELREVDWNEPEPILHEVPSQRCIRERVVTLLERAPLESGRPSLNTDDVYLYQTGMAAIYHVSQYLGALRPGTTILFGFAFHSTPHTLEDFGTGYKFFGLGTEYDELESFLAEEKRHNRAIQGLWAEFPANPLLVTPDIARLRKLANQYAFPLLVDDKVGSFCNVDLLGAGGADVLITSLTKSFSGYADVMAGSAVLNPASKRHDALRQLFDSRYTNDLFSHDADVLYTNSEDYLERSRQLNATAAYLVDYLDGSGSAAIAKVWYPTTSATVEYYKSRMRPATSSFTQGYGCLFSVELKTSGATRAFYDALGDYVHIGPHLGAHITLVLAYNKAIYAKDLEGVGKYGINERQIRVSVGLEDKEYLKLVFQYALNAAEEAMVEEREVGIVASIT